MSSGSLIQVDARLEKALSDLDKSLKTGALRHLQVEVKLVRSPSESAAHIRSFSEVLMREAHEISKEEIRSTVLPSMVWDFNSRPGWLYEEAAEVSRERKS